MARRSPHRSRRVDAATAPDTRRTALPAPPAATQIAAREMLTTSTEDSTGAIGAPGNLNISGFLTGEDYNKDLDGYKAYKTYDEMRKSDAQVRATLAMCKLPVKAATWDIQAASDDPQDQLIADQVREALLTEGAMDLSWGQILDNALLKIDFGSSVHEMIWTVDDGALPSAGRLPQIVTNGGVAADIALHRTRLKHLRLALREGQPHAKIARRFGIGLADIAALQTHAPALRFKSLEPRLPRTFYRWIEDRETGALVALEQFAPKAGRYGFFTIPRDKFVLHVNQREGNNWYGVSDLRGAYLHWFYKQQLYRIAAVAADREHAGVPRAKLQEGYSPQKAALEKITRTLKGLRSNDVSFLVQPSGVEYDWLTSQNAEQRMQGLVQLVEHHNVMIARNMLQQFSAQGEQRHGSFGTASVTLEAFYDGLEGVVDEICGELGQQAIRALCQANFAMGDRPLPKLVCSDLGKMDAAKLAAALQQLSSAKVLTPDDDLEDWVRDILNAPALPAKLRGQSRAKPVPTPFGGQPPALGDPPPPINAAREIYREAGIQFARVPTAFERKVFNLHGVPRQLDNEKARLVRQLTDLRLAQLKKLAETLAKKDARDTAPFTDLRAKHLPAPQTDEIKRAIRAMQGRVVEYGAAQVREELGRQGHPVEMAGPRASRNKQTLNSALVSSADTAADRLGQQWQNLALENAQRLRRSGLIGDELAQAIVDGMTDEAEKWVARAAGEEVNEAFGLGRAWQAEQLKDRIGSAQYSCVLDANSCDTCSNLDGQEFEMDSEEYEANMPPNADCDGRDSCRCVYLYLSTAEE